MVIQLYLVRFMLLTFLNVLCKVITNNLADSFKIILCSEESCSSAAGQSFIFILLLLYSANTLCTHAFHNRKGVTYVQSMF
jgi:hypothetical protein